MPTPTEIGTVLQGVGSIGQFLAIGAAAWFGYSSWKKQKIAEKLQDQAERILTATYKARRALDYVRSPIVQLFERDKAEKILAESEISETTPRLNRRGSKLVTAQVIYNRLNTFKDEQFSLDECLAMSKLLFGTELERQVLELINIFNEISVAAEMFSDLDGHDDVDFVEQIRSTIFNNSRPGVNNMTTDRIDRAVNLIETICTPHLRLSTNF